MICRHPSSNGSYCHDHIAHRTGARSCREQYGYGGPAATRGQTTSPGPERSTSPRRVCTRFALPSTLRLCPNSPASTCCLKYTRPRPRSECGRVYLTALDSAPGAPPTSGSGRGLVHNTTTRPSPSAPTDRLGRRARGRSPCAIACPPGAQAPRPPRAARLWCTCGGCTRAARSVAGSGRRDAMVRRVALPRAGGRDLAAAFRKCADRAWRRCGADRVAGRWAGGGPAGLSCAAR